jgi:hypothetical protein
MDVICCSELWLTFTGLYCPISQKAKLFTLQIVSWKVNECVFLNTSLLIERKKVLLNSLPYILKCGFLIIFSLLPFWWVIKVKKTITGTVSYMTLRVNVITWDSLHALLLSWTTNRSGFTSWKDATEFKYEFLALLVLELPIFERMTGKICQPKNCSFCGVSYRYRSQCMLSYICHKGKVKSRPSA